MDNAENNKKVINELEKISKEYWEKIDALKVEQTKVISEYVFKLEEKKKEELRDKFNSI
jgi:hypothetical protein